MASLPPDCAGAGGGGNCYCLWDLAWLAQMMPRKRATQGRELGVAVDTSRGHPCGLGSLDWEDNEVSGALISLSSPGARVTRCPRVPLTNPQVPLPRG